MDDNHLERLNELASFLEAEVAGQPFDRDSARSLASRLALEQPEIAKTLHLMQLRLGADTPLN